MVLLKINVIFVHMDKVMIFVVTIYWVTTSLYVMNWHRKRNDLDIGTILLAIFLGPILSIIIYDSERDERKRKSELEQREMGDRHRRWFQTMGLINRNAIPGYGRTIPPPPSRRPRVEDIRAEWRRQNGISKLKDFKFLRGNVKD